MRLIPRRGTDGPADTKPGGRGATKLSFLLSRETGQKQEFIKPQDSLVNPGFTKPPFLGGRSKTCSK